jgi:putative DNA primase/helicase
VWTLQRIYSDGNKRFHPGGCKAGHFHVIGPSLNQSHDIYICEGLTTGASIYAAIGQTTVVAFDAYNLLEVVQNIRNCYPHISVILCADNDQWKEKNTGIDYAKNVASKHRLKMVYPTFDECLSETKPTDFNDLHQLAGLDAVKTQLTSHVHVIEPTDEEEFIHLALLSRVEYDREEQKVARHLGIKVSTLRQEVEAIRFTLCPVSSKEDDEIFPSIDPWPDMVDIKTVLDDLLLLLNKCVFLSSHADTAIALWIVFTWCIDSFDTAPILAVYSPEKRCGKTTLLSLISKLVYRPLTTANTTASSLFRSIERWNPTLLIDEADTFLKKSDDLRGVINAGHKRETAFVLRTVGEDHAPKRFMVWGAKTIALIGKLPETLHDRSIVILMRRKKGEEQRTRLRDINRDQFEDLCRKLKRFGMDNQIRLKMARPHLSPVLSDRAADNWEPLLAIADMAGPEWADRSQRASLALSHPEREEEARGTQLLKSIYHIFMFLGKEKISSQDLIDELCKDEEEPWKSYNKDEYPISAKQISHLLKAYGISSKDIKFQGMNLKGYEKHQFKEAWERYLNREPF